MAPELLEFCAAAGEEAEEPVELVAAPEVLAAAPELPVAAEVVAPDCAATAAWVNAASKLENRFAPAAARPLYAVEYCVPPKPLVPGERCGGDCPAMRPCKPEMALIDIM